MDYGRLLATIILCGLGLWFAMTRQANFDLGGEDNPPRPEETIFVRAKGLDAIAIGTFFIALGALNLSQGIRSERRFVAFWIGAALFIAAVLYGITIAVMAIVEAFG